MGAKVSGARSAELAQQKPTRVGQVGIIESSGRRTVPLARISALSDRRQLFKHPLSVANTDAD